MQDRLETTFERALFGFRWLLAPIYFGLGLSLLLLLYKFMISAWTLALSATTGSSGAIIVGLLGLIDISLMANLPLRPGVGLVRRAPFHVRHQRLIARSHGSDHGWTKELKPNPTKLGRLGL